LIFSHRIIALIKWKKYTLFLTVEIGCDDDSD